MSTLPKIGEVELKGDLARDNLVVIDRGEEIFTQPYKVCTYEIVPREGTYLMVHDFIHERDSILKVSSENGRLSSSEADELESDGPSLGGLYMGRITITMGKRLGKGPDLVRPKLKGDLPSGFLPKGDITCLDDVIDFMETTIPGIIQYNRANLHSNLTVGRFLREGGVCAHFAQFLSKALDEEEVPNFTISGLGVNTVDDGVRYYSTLDDEGISPHGFIEVKFGHYYWLDPTRWATMSREEHGKRNVLGQLRRRCAVRVKERVGDGITSPNLFERWLGPRKSIGDDLNLYYADSIEILP